MDHVLHDMLPARHRLPLPLLDSTPQPARHARAGGANIPAPSLDGLRGFHARLEDRQFEVMERAFARHGGMATADGVARMMRCRSEQPISELARWLVDRRVVQIEWQGHTWLPLFQFEREHMTLRPEVAQAVRALSDKADDWNVALWFATPHCGLDHEAPVDALRRDPAAVAEAASAHHLALHD
jgi:hypothetical protein